MTYVPSTNDVYMIAFITSRGWEYDKYQDTWSKSGFSKEVEVPSWKDTSRTREQKVDFDLEDAFAEEYYKE